MKKFRCIMMIAAVTIMFIFPMNAIAGISEDNANQNRGGSANITSTEPVTGDKTFTVTKYPLGQPENEALVGEYDTFYDAIDACKQEDLSNQYVVTMNKDCNIPETEYSWGRSSVNILLKSREGHKYTLKRLGDRDFMTVYSKCTLRIENIILDGNNSGQAFMVAGENTPEGAHLILGKGTVIQNFKDIPKYDGTTFYLAEGNSTLTIEEGTVLQNNTATQAGGIIQARQNTTINIKGGLFKNNSSIGAGGVLFTNGKLNITGGIFENNQGKYGGALWIGSKSTATVENAIFRNNKAKESNGGAIWNSNELKLKNSTFEGNQSPKWGGAIVGQKSMTIENSTFKDNKASGIGGAVAMYPTTKLTVKDSSFTGNSAISAGAIYMLSSTDESTISGCTFSDNKATNNGGAIWSNNAPVSIESSTLQNNGNGNSFGGGLCVNGDKTYNVKNSIFKGNKSKNGGGIFVMGGTLSVEGTTLESNIAETETDQQGNISEGIGGAILSLKDTSIKSEMIISKSHIKNNEARNGAGVTVASGKVEIKDTEFNGNDTKGPEDDQEKRLGGALYIDDDANVNISDGSKFIDNKSGIGGAIFDVSSDYSNPVDVNKYQNLKIEGTTLFKGNEAKIGLYNPPSNFVKFNNLQFSKDSDVPHNKYMSKSLLNNYDINYKGGLLITYDANGGKFTDGKSIKQELHKENDTIIITDAPKRDGYKFLYWKGSEYQPGATYTVKDNHTFVAQWEKISNPTLRNTPPELKVKDTTINVGDNLDLKTLIIKARDKEDGENLIDKVVIDRGNFDNNKPGEYKITFTLTDRAGASVTKIATVTVTNKSIESKTPVVEKNNQPKTGDSSHAAIYITVVVLAVLALALLVIIKKRRGRK